MSSLGGLGGGIGRPYVAVLIVPTGIGASIGGYAGDALPAATVLASIADVLVTHPNVMNAASLYGPRPNILYTEGYALDQWAAGRLGLRPGGAGAGYGQHRIGLLLDAAMEPELVTRHLQAAEAARASLGVCVSDWALTDAPLGVGLRTSPDTGASWGTLQAPSSLVRAAKGLVQDRGCTALAVVARFPDEADKSDKSDGGDGGDGDDEAAATAAAAVAAYRAGCGVDGVGGAEALLSHLVTMATGVPCAHAPAEAPLPLDPNVHPRACAEELGHTFLPCVLANLRHAPALVHPPYDAAAADADAPAAPARAVRATRARAAAAAAGDVWASDARAVVVPASACGGSAVLSLLQQPGLLLIVVRDNETAMRCTPEVLRLASLVREKHRGACEVVEVRDYLDAAGVLAAHKAGVLPSTLTAATTRIRGP